MNALVRTRLLFIVIAGIVGAGAGWLFTETVLKKEQPAAYVDTAPTAAELIGTRRPDYSLGGTNGEIISAADFDGQVLLINFWATWCTPCREEMPMLSDLYTQLSPEGFSVIGIALDDVAQARKFVEELGVRYPVMVGGTDVMATGVAYGNRAGMLPYSVLIDSGGVIRWTRLGVLEPVDLEKKIMDLLAARPDT